MFFYVEINRSGKTEKYHRLTAAQVSAMFLQKRQPAYGVASMIQDAEINHTELKIDVLIGIEQISVRSLSDKCCCLEIMGDENNCVIHGGEHARDQSCQSGIDNQRDILASVGAIS